MLLSICKPQAHWALLLMAVFSLPAAQAQQQELHESLFGPVDALAKEANEAGAGLLAPKNYSAAAAHYREAEDKLRRGRSIESIRDELRDAREALQKAIEAARLAQVTLTDAIEARNDAVEADAEKFAPDKWRKAEDKFRSAALKLEDGNVKSARSRARDAERLYRDAELAAIKANYLDETRRLIQQAEDRKVDRLAPRTMDKARALLAQAENQLTRNRYDTDEPRNLAREAKYEVSHAMYLAKALEPVRADDVTLEEFALAAEQPLQRIASRLDAVAEFDEGPDKPAQLILARIDGLQKQARELAEARAQIADLQQELQQMEQQLGTQSQRLAAQEEQRRRIRQIESLFAPGEAEVFTQGRNILIRPIGLVFPSGSAQIEPRYFGLLRKVQDAIRTFPNATIVIEGHTDSYGSDAVNMKLSQARAEAVREYLLANVRELAPEDVQAVGYGETRPVANNETVEGRAKNRRIDIVLKPKG
ncbi:MAG: hypothetical protein D6727_10035 [Gammaproteobacteria bacterium]|nr:MAG: hypothetical protein D6727_10035 [Gammaproteobacteria bacterium]